jgi:hypothetical protein
VPEAKISFTYNPVARRRIATFSGSIEDGDLMGAYAELLRDPEYDHGADDLVDLRAVERFGVTESGLKNIMALFAPVDQLGIPTRLAIVAPNDDVYGVSLMYRTLRGDDVPEQIEVFREMDAAEDWLNRGAAERAKDRAARARGDSTPAGE